MTKKMIYKEIEEMFNLTGEVPVDKNKILSILKPGTFIKTQFYGIEKWSVNVILNNNNGYLAIPYIDDDGLIPVLANDTIRFRYTIEDFDINVTCIVKNIAIRPNPIKILEIVKVDIWKNKRAAIRQNANFICKGIDELGEEFSCCLINLSNSGSGIVCKENIRVGSNVKLKFYGSSTTLSEVTGFIVRGKRIYDHKFEYGAKFVDVNHKTRVFLDNLLDSERTSEIDIYLKLCKKYSITALLEI